MRGGRYVILGMMLIFGVEEARALDWPQWRGPSRDGHMSDFRAPSTWSSELELVWRTEVGRGYSSPVASSGSICVHTREDDDEVVSCLAAETGRVLWSSRYPADYVKNSYALDHGKGPNATPIIDGARFFTLGMSGILSAFDLESGDLLWREDFSERVSTKKLFCGTSASPLVEGDMVVVHVGDDVTGGMLVALDKTSGEHRWKWEGLGPGYASPAAVELAGTRQIVTMTSGSIVGVTAENGQPLWQIEFEDEWNENIVTPVFAGDLMIVAGVRRGTLGFQIKVKDGQWTAEQRWARSDLPQYMSSPVIVDGTLFGFSSRQKGQLFSLDLSTGASLWEGEGRWGKNAALVALGSEHLAVLTTEGVLHFGKRQAGSVEPAAQYVVSEGATWAHPLIVGGEIAVKDGEDLALWRLVDQGSDSADR